MVVNTTSQGMIGQPPLDLRLDALPPTALVVDIVYVPLETPLLAAARRRGNPTVDGLGMLLHQACVAWRLWFGLIPRSHPNCAPPSKKPSHKPRTIESRIPNPESRLIATTHVTPATLNRHDRLRPFSRFPSRPRQAEGIDHNWLTLGHHEIFARFTFNRELDVGELSFAKFVDPGDARTDSDIIGLPVVCSRLFRFSSFYVNKKASIKTGRRTSRASKSARRNGRIRRPSTCAAGCTTSRA